MKSSNSQLALCEGLALIDKVVFYNISIVGFRDPDRLIYHDQLQGYNDSYDPDRDHFVYKCPSGQIFKRLIIKDDMIDALSASHTNFGESCTMQISVHDDSQTNVRCWTVEQHLDYLRKVQDHLQDDYGIVVDLSEIKLKSIEINRTFTLQDRYEDYYRVFQLMMVKLAWPMKHEQDYKYNGADRVYPGTYISKNTGNPKENRYIQFKIYNKTKAVSQVISITDNICRMELTIVGQDQIRKKLGSSNIVDLTDETINDFYDKWVEKYIVKPLKKWGKDRDKRILDIIRYERATDQRRWRVNVLRTIMNTEIEEQCPLALDVRDFFKLFPRMKNVSQSAAKRYRAGFRKLAESHETVLCRRDDLRLQEIVDKLTAHHSEVHILNIDDGLEVAS